MTQPTQPTKDDLAILEHFLTKYPDVKHVRLQYTDYTGTIRARVVPMKRIQESLQTDQQPFSIGITMASLALFQNDSTLRGVSPAGEYRLHPIFSTLRYGPSRNTASAQCEFRDQNGESVALCPHSILRTATEDAAKMGLTFLAGFEIEIVFMSCTNDGSYTTLKGDKGHAWSSARGLQNPMMLGVIEEIIETLELAGIFLEQWHLESAPGQYEFVLPAEELLTATETLLHARDIITTTAARHSLRATLHPKPFPMACGSASHLHLSIPSVDKNRKIYEAFYAGILRSLRSIIAFTYSHPTSYERAVDGAWAGGTWIAWGSQNRETPLRKVKDSHWEFKCLDGIANIYLAIAAVVIAGTSGVKDELALPMKDCTLDPACLGEREREDIGILHRIPKSLTEALDSLENDASLKKLMGRDVVQRYRAIKHVEIKMFEDMTVEEGKTWIIDRY